MPSADATRSRALFVVGAGRSGTSVITRGLLALGVELGDKLKRPTDKNPTGFFEDEDLLRIAKRVRGVLGLRSESVALIDPAQWHSAALEPLRAEAAETIQRRFGAYPLWGFKYAQTLRMLPFWEDVFARAGLEVAWVVAARNPLSVARSRAKLDALRGRQEKSDLEWLVNVVPYFRRLAERPFVVVDYDLLMADPAGQLGRIARKLGIALDSEARKRVQEYVDSFLSDGMRHTRFGVRELEGDAGVLRLTRDAYLWLRRLAADEIAPDDRAFWDDWTRIERGVAELAPALRHVDYLEALVRSHRAGPLLSAWQRLLRRARGR